MHTGGSISFDENFVMLEFHPRALEHLGGEPIPWNDSDDLLILNLVSRKEFWLRRARLVNQIKAKISGEEEDEDDHGYELRTDTDLGWFVREIKVGTNEIEMKCKITLKKDEPWYQDEEEEERPEDRRYI